MGFCSITDLTRTAPAKTLRLVGNWVTTGTMVVGGGGGGEICLCGGRSGCGDAAFGWKMVTGGGN